MNKIDAYAHVLLPNFYSKMLEIDESIPQKMPFINNEVLTNLEERRKYLVPGVKEIISYVNINPEDYVDKDESYKLCKDANEELIETIRNNSDIFSGGIGMIPMNNIDGAIDIMENQIKENEELVGVQLFTRALKKSIADDEFEKVFEMAEKLDLVIFLHPIFDDRKPDNNIVFSWEYELSQAMMQIVEKDIYKKYPNLKIIVHHAGAMVPFFAGRIKYILGEEKEKQFKKFYVDTALLGNTKALELAGEYFGMDHLIFGTDAPFGILPAGATKEIDEAIDEMNVTNIEKEDIYNNNILKIINR